MNREPSIPGLAMDENGASLVEYALLIALISLICIAAISLMGANMSTMFSTVSTSL